MLRACHAFDVVQSIDISVTIVDPTQIETCGNPAGRIGVVSNIHASPAVKHIVALEAGQNIVPRQSEDRIGPRRPDEIVRSGGSHNTRHDLSPAISSLAMKAKLSYSDCATSR